MSTVVVASRLAGGLRIADAMFGQKRKRGRQSPCRVCVCVFPIVVGMAAFAAVQFQTTQILLSFDRRLN